MLWYFIIAVLWFIFAPKIFHKYCDHDHWWKDLANDLPILYIILVVISSLFWPINIFVLLAASIPIIAGVVIFGILQILMYIGRTSNVNYLLSKIKNFIWKFWGIES
jgi:uncharacterized membrane-anchored protein